jgi:hypothetical protein
MRADMAKVVTESSRSKDWQGGDRSLKTGGRVRVQEFNDEDRWADYDGSTRHPISRFRQFGSNAKGFSDRLGPLRKYLRKQVGRPWDVVYSELSAVLDKRSISGLHIWDHVFMEVERYVIIKNGCLFHKPRFGGYRPISGLYVHPRHGLLCWSNTPPWPRYIPKPFLKIIGEDGEKLIALDFHRFKINELHELINDEGIWYIQSFQNIVRTIVTYGPCRVCGPLALRTVRVTVEAHAAWTGHEWHGKTFTKTTTERKATTRHQLNAKELKRYGLTNTPKPAAAPSRRSLRRGAR